MVATVYNDLKNYKMSCQHLRSGRHPRKIRIYDLSGRKRERMVSGGLNNSTSVFQVEIIS